MLERIDEDKLENCDNLAAIYDLVQTVNNIIDELETIQKELVTLSLICYNKK